MKVIKQASSCAHTASEGKIVTMAMWVKPAISSQELTAAMSCACACGALAGSGSGC